MASLGSNRTARLLPLLLVALAFQPLLGAPTVPNEIKQPGTQPEDQVSAFATNCDSCHGGTDNPELEPSFGWKGGMMSHAARDPLFWATLAIAEQDFLPNADPNQRGGAGDLCLRCHTPNAWLQGRSTPTDGSALTGNDERGVECEFCHLLVNPDPPLNVPGTVEEQNAPFVANDGTDGYYGSGEFVINSGGTRLGPYADASANHQFLQSSFHRQGELCGTCHDVSNAAVGDLAHNHGAQIPLDPGTYSGVVGGPIEDKAAFNNPPAQYGIVERTFSEWKAGALDEWRVDDFDLLPDDLKIVGGAPAWAYSRAFDVVPPSANPNRPNYVDGTVRYFTCQTCHMAAATGKGCNKNNAPTRYDLPRHDQTGGGYWMPDVVIHQHNKGTLRFGTLDAEQIAAMEAGKSRAGFMLQAAASVSASQAGEGLVVRVTNLTGHKLISGYPEGRRMWLNVRWFDAADSLIGEEGAYGSLGRTVNDLDGTSFPVESILDPDDTVVYEAKPGMDQAWAAQLISLGYDPQLVLEYDRLDDTVELTLGDLAAESPGHEDHTFHFVLNNVVVSDNRIPPFGFAYSEAEARNALPVPSSLYGNPGSGGTYEHWGTTAFSIPQGAVTAEVRLYYQQTSWEYIQFLWLQNDGLNASLGSEGVNLLDAWLNTGMSPPFEMASAVASVTAGCQPTSTFDDTCDGIDDDCDDLFDEDYVPTATTCGVGECAAEGQLICDEGEIEDTCAPGTPSADDQCNGLDDDCDGAPDDGYVPTATTCGVGECAADGQLACVAGQLEDTCTPGAPSADDQCDGLDDDCDGTPDDGYVPPLTTCGVGECFAEGQLLCVAGQTQDTCTPGTPSADDQCNGLDDDCDGTPDDGYVSTATSCGVGECAADGQLACVAGQLEDTCTPGTPVADDQCNGLDDDCDGTPDDGYVPTLTTCGVGECAEEGQLICVAGQTQDTCNPGAPSADDQCNGLDDDCDGSPDDGYVPTATACGVGECAAEGQLTCVAGQVEDTCTPGTPVADDQCNGLDDDCDGTPDDGYVPATSSCGVGECAAEGQLTCVAGQIEDTCTPGTPSADDQCNGLDDDCDGSPDDGYVPTATACGVGECAAEGQLTCVAGQVEDTCTPGTPVADDQCNGLDDDCDGTPDDGYVPTTSSCGVGECAAEGQLTCVAGQIEDTCTPGTPSADDQCNGLDDDCDGSPDDGYVPTATACGVGECAAEGQLTCVAGQVEDTCTPGTPVADDQCNGLDDDCDGTPDDGYVPTTSSCGVGECAAEGQLTCVAGQIEDTCTPGTPSADDQCNGLDDDCDGSPDDGYVPTATACGVGECAAEGQLTCVAGQVEDTCTPGTPVADDQCNGLDDDCDGTPDDGYVPTTSSCGVGECAAEGQLTCVAGQIEDTCTPGTPSADDQCNGLDDDCDGAPDDDYIPTTTTCGVGECAAEGQWVCIGGQTVDTCTPGTPVADDQCNGLDDDCDGTPDDGYVPSTTTCGVGECAEEGQLLCAAGQTEDTCTPGTPSADDQCNGLDDDCDGTPDDDYVPTVTTCGVGNCEGNTGTLLCQDGVIDDTCDPLQGSTDEICDELDNDCNGEVDEGFDSDLDTIADCVDNCPGHSNPDQINQDGDSFGDVCDCAPLDETNAPAVPIDSSLLLAKSGTEALLSWADGGLADPFALYRGEHEAGQAFEYNHVCMEAPITEPQAADADVPEPGRVWYYLVSRLGACGESPLGHGSEGGVRPNENACPF